MKLRYRDILLWRTGNNMGNAAVMGVVPQVRYIMLSDLLLQTMSDREIEAVFAHEAGHVVHRHLAWYGVFVMIIMAMLLVMAKIAEMLNIELAFVPPWMRDPLLLVMSVAIFFLLFGVLSRCFERQADVFAARTMQLELAPATVAGADAVGRDGADVLSSALRRVATVNNIPLRGRDFYHGSIWQRMNYLKHLSTDPLNTARFDRFMSWVYRSLLVALLASIASITWMIWKG
jgi:STE24 endopeptidase